MGVRNIMTILENRLVEAIEIIEQLASAGIELDDERLSYMTIQVDRDLVERAKKWLDGGV